MDDPGPTAIFWIISLALTAFTFVVKLGEAAVEDVNEKKVRESAEDENRKAIKLAKLLDKKAALRDTASVITAFSLSIISAMATLLFANTFYRFLLPLLLPIVRIKAVPVLLSLFAPLALSAVIFTAMAILLPSKLGSQRAETLALRLAGFLRFACALVLPVKWIVSLISGLFVLVFGADPHYEDAPVTEDEILSIVDEGEEKGVIEESQKEMINNIFEFDDLTAGDVMTHRTDVESVEATATVQEIIAIAIEEGYSRMPVFEDDIDDIKGILYVKDLLKYVGTEVSTEIKAADLMREAYFIPESKKCRDIFTEMTEKHLQMVIVSDEYGGVAGIVTIEDLIESIMGSIQDEFDDEEEEIEQISENIFTIDGTSDINEVAELLEIEFPEGEYETVAGYIMSVLGKVPEKDEHPIVEYSDFSFMVAEMDERRIARVIAERVPETLREPNE
ncbi:MAG: HlyC/CorC family transporter [Ruminococcaceae bacterium]|nr:HlyC/CorC family transporter [Oscillospiraceae bacterium]